MRAPLGRGGQTHPTAQEQATPVSVSQSHQLGEKGLGAEREGRAGDSASSLVPGISRVTRLY